MGDGYAPRILVVDLTTRKTEVLDTEDYKEWGGGEGMGARLFWDLCKDKTVAAFDPGNVITLGGGAFAGTPVPSGARTAVTGIGPAAYPTEWFTSSNFGGRFAGMLKMAGWQMVAVTGKADTPVWIDIRDEKVEIRDAGESGDKLWGLDAHETQRAIHSLHGADGHWRSNGDTRDGGRTTQHPAVVTIGLAGENMTRIASLIHDGGAGAGQGGFGGVFGAKNLKAISVIGTGSIEVADPAELLSARLWAADNYGYQPDNLKAFPISATGMVFSGLPSSATAFGAASRPEGCMNCHKSCHGVRSATGLGNGSHCYDTQIYQGPEAAATGKVTGETQARLGDLLQSYSINTIQLDTAGFWLNQLLKKGLVGPGKQVDTDIFEKYTFGTFEWAAEMLARMAEKREIGELLSEGVARAAVALGRYEEDTKSGDLPLQEWGYPHHYDGRTEAEWGFGSLLSSRDINAHDFNWICMWTVTLHTLYGLPMPIEAEDMANVIGAKLAPYNDPMLIDYSDEGMYSESMAKLVSWHTAYYMYYKNSLGLCDWAYADFVNPNTEDKAGLTGIAEPRYVKGVIGREEPLEDGIKVGTKIWNLNRAIYILQGRHRDQEVYGDYMYDVPSVPVPGYMLLSSPQVLPVFEDGKWSYKMVAGRMCDREKVEDWKTIYFELEGWDPATGWPKRETLEKMDMKFVADELDRAGKLGA
ncbi:MAG: aldehyde:ferredoxin oxidoreductase [Coriobacteriia bacterium]|nr:aldehyde:ferredoxin oxidoreductase [Coriobacteriia bacterium]MBN2839892.1 aldehyde:ferredoxin oxidoreductase [Coriobacteriia bacterium]